MSERLAAHFENRTYYFFLESQKENEVKIIMYGTPYTFQRSGVRWINTPYNVMEMRAGLVSAVMLALGIV